MRGPSSLSLPEESCSSSTSDRTCNVDFYFSHHFILFRFSFALRFDLFSSSLNSHHLCFSSFGGHASPLHLHHDRLLGLEEPLDGLLVAALGHVHAIHLARKVKVRDWNESESMTLTKSLFVAAMKYIYPSTLWLGEKSFWSRRRSIWRHVSRLLGDRAQK